jgi:hypothetical protein
MRENVPSIEKHIQTSIERTEKDYREIHEWIDHPGKKPQRHDLGRV